MIRLLLFCCVVQIVHSSCVAPLKLVAGGECRGLGSSAPKGEYMRDAINKAITACAQKSAYPVAIHSDDQQSYWCAQKGNDYTFALGLTCNTKSLKWEWADGSTVDYKPALQNYDKELDEDCLSGCTWYLSKGSGHWWHNCTDPTLYAWDFFCISELEQPVASTDCGNFNDDNDDGVCFEIVENKLTWGYAQTVCHSFGSEVASVHSEKENAYIRRLAVSRGATNGVLIGGTISGKGTDFGWIDGSDWDYTNFYPSFPIDGLGECLTMDTITTAGQWMNTDCNAGLPVVCSRPFNDKPEQNGCSSGPWKESQIIYSPGFPDDASVPCDYFLTVEAGKKVQLQILLLEANNCCDFVYLMDGYVGGAIIANLTGEESGKYYYTKTSNVMRVSWQPNGGVNVRGLMMRFWAN